jgi:hypothetical protein
MYALHHLLILVRDIPTYEEASQQNMFTDDDNDMFALDF